MAARKNNGSKQAASRKRSRQNEATPKSASRTRATGTRAKKEKKASSTATDSPLRAAAARSGISGDLQQGGFQVIVCLQTGGLGAAQILYSCQKPQSPTSVRRHVAQLLGSHAFQIDRAYLRDRRHPARSDWEATPLI